MTDYRSYFDRAQAKQNMNPQEYSKWLNEQRLQKAIERNREKDGEAQILLFVCGIGGLIVLIWSAFSNKLASTALLLAPMPIGFTVCAILSNKKPGIAGLALVGAFLLPLLLAALFIW